MKAKTNFTILELIHVVIGLALIGMHANVDEALKQWITEAISDDIKALRSIAGGNCPQHWRGAYHAHKPKHV